MHGENGFMCQPQVVSIRGLLSWINFFVHLFLLSRSSVLDVNDEFFTGWCLCGKAQILFQKLMDLMIYF